MPTSPIAALRPLYLSGAADPLTTLNTFLPHSSTNASHNTYLSQDPAWSRHEAASLKPADIATKPLYGIPVSLKDCFDLAGFPTSCGSSFYRDYNGIATLDSTIAARLRHAGAVITGKTHLHQLAYGITGENENYGDCLQPHHPSHLTGGSSSGAAASILEGSALAAIGTDTGGSIRVPAALCGLAGFRSSITRNTPPNDELWLGGAHLSPSFDTIGWLYRSLADGPTLGSALLNIPIAPTRNPANLRIGIPTASFLHDAEPTILASFDTLQAHLSSLGITLTTFDPTPWQDAFAILAPIQASEAAALHAGLFHHFEPAIAARLAWGASITPSELAAHHARLAAFRTSTYALFSHFDYLLLPAAPMVSLLAGADQTDTRTRILRYTAPISLAGLPTVTLPMLSHGNPAGGFQLVAPLNADANLLTLSTLLSDILTPTV
jgi:Asp-tRNA(Asn)/Glu-tRNA(Gln) amidotransferase A subunit family amidase